MEASVRASCSGTRTGVDVRRSFDGRLVGQSWETPFVEVPAGEHRCDGDRQMIERFHDEYERRYGNRFPLCRCRASPTACSSWSRPTRSTTKSSAARGGDPADAEPTRTLQLRHLEREPLAAPEYAARRRCAPGDQRSPAPRSSASRCRRRLSVPGQLARRSAGSGRSSSTLSHDRPDPRPHARGVRRALRLPTGSPRPCSPTASATSSSTCAGGC